MQHNAANKRECLYELLHFCIRLPEHLKNKQTNKPITRDLYLILNQTRPPTRTQTFQTISTSKPEAMVPSQTTVAGSL